MPYCCHEIGKRMFDKCGSVLKPGINTAGLVLQTKLVNLRNTV